MARSVVAARPLASGPVFAMYGLPRLSDGALRAYPQQRLEIFPQPTTNQCCVTISVPETDPVAVDSDDSDKELPWAHTLYHDAESVFWLLVWWAIHLRNPTDSNPTSSSNIPDSLFGLLTTVDPVTKEDYRDQFLIEIAKTKHWLDSAYQELEVLFRQMAKNLQGDLYWAKDKEMSDPEFLHEAFQRLIFNFLKEHENAEFMRLKKHPSKRVVQGDEPAEGEATQLSAGATRSACTTSSAGTKRSACTIAGSDHDRVSHLFPPALMHTTYSYSPQSALGEMVLGSLQNNEFQWVSTMVVNLCTLVPSVLLL